MKRQSAQLADARLVGLVAKGHNAAEAAVALDPGQNLERRGKRVLARMADEHDRLRADGGLAPRQPLEHQALGAAGQNDVEQRPVGRGRICAPPIPSRASEGTREPDQNGSGCSLVVKGTARDIEGKAVFHTVRPRLTQRYHSDASDGGADLEPG